MATSDWAIPTGKAITGATYIKDTDDNIAATIEDLRDWCNNANGTYTDWTLTGLRTDFVDVNTAQTITAVKTIDTLGAIDFTGGELRIGSTAVTATAAELNILDGVTATTAEINKLDGVTASTTELNYVTGVTSAIQTQIDGKASLTGATFTGQVKGITPVSAEDLTRKDYVDSVVPTSGTYVPTITAIVNVSTATANNCRYNRVGDIVFVSGSVGYTPTASGTMTFTISLPVASSIISGYGDVAGSGSTGITATTAQVYGYPTTNTARCVIVAPSTASDTVTFTFSYIVQ